MLNLDVILRIPAEVSSTSVENGAVIINLNTGKYFALREIGQRFWELLKGGAQTREAYLILVNEYEVEPERLEQDLLDLLNQLLENGLVQLTPE